MKLLKECRAPPNAHVRYVLLNHNSHGFEWSDIPPTSISSLCRDFHAFLYRTTRKYEAAKQNLNKKDMFIAHDTRTNTVRIVVKDLTYDDARVPRNAKRVRIPQGLQNLIQNQGHAAAIPVALAGTAGAIAAASLALLARNWKSGSVSQETTKNTRQGSEKSTVFENFNASSGLLKDYVAPIKDVYVSADVPGTFFTATKEQKLALGVAVKVFNSKETSFPFAIEGVCMHVGSLASAIPLVWSRHTLEWNYCPKGCPWVYYYKSNYSDDASTWRYYPVVNTPLLRFCDINLGTIADKVFVDPTWVWSPHDAFTEAYRDCVSVIGQFARVEKLLNLFYLVKANQHTRPKFFEKTKVEVQTKMEKSRILCSKTVQKMLELILLKVSATEQHALQSVYKKLGTWKDLAKRLLTKRMLWYCGHKDWGCYHNHEFCEGSNQKLYSSFVRDKLDSYLLPEEAVASSLLGLQVPSFPYDDGANTFKFDQHVVLLAQSGASLEEAKDENGSGFLVDYPTTTIFQDVIKSELQKAFPTEKTRLYRARCRLILAQSIAAAQTHEEETNLIITGLSLNDLEFPVQEFACALEAELGSIKARNNLKTVTVVDFGASQTLKPRIDAAGSDKGIAVKHKSREDPPFAFDLKDGVPMVSVAWNGISLVGNEYYNGKAESASAVAACSTSVAFLSHPCINPKMYERFSGVPS